MYEDKMRELDLEEIRIKHLTEVFKILEGVDQNEPESLFQAHRQGL